MLCQAALTQLSLTSTLLSVQLMKQLHFKVECRSKLAAYQQKNIKNINYSY